MDVDDNVFSDIEYIYPNEEVIQDSYSNEEIIQDSYSSEEIIQDSYSSEEVIPDYENIPCVIQPEEKTDATGSFFSTYFKMFTQPEYLIVYGSLLVLTIMLIILVYFGDSSPWFLSLVQLNVNTWVIRGAWIIATILSYVGFIFLWEKHVTSGIPIILIISIYFMITDLIFITWAAVAYYAQNLALTIWAAIVLFIYNLWLFFYIWNISILTAVFLIPNLILYAYLVYSATVMTSLNHVAI